MEKCDPEYKKRQDKIMDRLRKIKESIQKCTEDHPYTPDRDKKGTRWIHEDSREVPRSRNGRIILMECNICGKRWTKDLK